MSNLITPEVQSKIAEIEKNVSAICIAKISNQGEYESAGGVLIEIKKKYKEIETERKKITDPINASKEAVMSFFRKPLDFLADAEDKVKQAILTYQQAMERQRLLDEAKLQEQARALEEKEKAKIEKKIEKAEAKGDLDKVQDLQAQQAQVFVPAPIVASQVQKVQGVSTKKIWKYQVENARMVPEQYKIINEKALQALAGKGINIPGVRFYQEEVIATRI